MINIIKIKGKVHHIIQNIEGVKNYLVSSEIIINLTNITSSALNLAQQVFNRFRFENEPIAQKLLGRWF